MLRSTRNLVIGAGALLAVASIAVLVHGGRASTRAQTPAPSGAPTLDTRVAVSGTIPTATAADYRQPIATYRRYVRAQLARMLVDTRGLRAAIDGGDLRAAKRAWLAADARYESIGAAYGAFGSLDSAINGRPGGLPGGEKSPRFTGLHRVELALWGRNSTADAAPAARRLIADVRRLRAHLRSATIAPLDYSLRAHEVLEDSLQLQLAGVANRWSQSQLTALRANVAGTDVVYATLRPMVRRRNPGLADQAEEALRRLRHAITALAPSGSRLPTWDVLDQRERERINGLTASAAERLAYVPDLVDPRPPRPPKSALATEVSR